MRAALWRRRGAKEIDARAFLPLRLTSENVVFVRVRVDCLEETNAYSLSLVHSRALLLDPFAIAPVVGRYPLRGRNAGTGKIQPLCPNPPETEGACTKYWQYYFIDKQYT